MGRSGHSAAAKPSGFHPDQPTFRLYVTLLVLLMYLAPLNSPVDAAAASAANVIIYGPTRRLAQAASNGSAATNNLVLNTRNNVQLNRQPGTPTHQLPSEALPDVFDYASTLDADAVTVTFAVESSGASSNRLPATAEARITSITSQLTGTPAPSWTIEYNATEHNAASSSSQTQDIINTALDNVAQMRADESASGGNRRMLFEHVEQGAVSRRVLEQQEQPQENKQRYFTVSLSVFTTRPHLVVYRLTQQLADGASALGGCSTVYCSALVNAEVPIDTSSSIDVSPNLEALALKVSDSIQSLVPQAAATGSNDQQSSKLLAITIGSSVGGGVLTLVILAVLVIRCRGKGGCVSTYTKSDDKQPSLKRTSSVKRQPQHVIEFLTDDQHPLDYQQHLGVRMSSENQPISTVPMQTANGMSPVASSSTSAAAEEESCVASTPSEATTASIITNPSSGEEAALSADHSTPEKQQTPKPVSTRSRFLRIMSHDSLLSIRSNNSSQIGTRTSPKSVTDADDDDQPDTPEASFFEEEETADKVLKEIVPPSPEHEVAGGRVIFKVPKSNHHSGSNTPVSPFSPYSAALNDSTFGSLPGPLDAASAVSGRSDVRADSTATGSLTGAASRFTLPSGSMTPPTYAGALHARGLQFESLRAHSLCTTPPLMPDISGAEVDPKTLYDALLVYHDSLKRLQKALTPETTPGQSPVHTPRAI